MCGIAGMFDFSCNRREKRSETDRMLYRIKHRGPDDNGVCGITWDNRLAQAKSAAEIPGNLKGILGFNRLSIQDISDAGHQPMVSEDKKAVITFNGEIYNVTELRKRLLLENPAIKFRGTSDTEVILYLYQRYGFTQMIEQLNGMFCIVLYDAREEKLYIARDRFGIIPLHLWIRNEGIIWASEIKCFLELEDFNKKINKISFSRALQYCYPNDSLYQDIQSVEPGTIMEVNVSSGDTRAFHYYNLASAGEKIKGSKEEILEQCNFLLKRCVERQLISDVSVGVQFSGGIDSTLLAKYVSDFFCDQKEQLYGFSLVNREYADYNEELWIDRAASCIPIQVKKFDMTKDRFFQNFEKSLYAYERLINIPSPIGIYEFSKNAGRDVTVLISGEGADEVCGGYGSFAVWKIMEQIRIPSLMPPLFLLKFDMQLSSLKCNRLYESFDLGNIWEERLKYWNELTGNGFDKGRKLYFKYELISLLERQNKVCMAHSVENRVPFLDNELVDFMFSIPEDSLLYKRKKTGDLASRVKISKSYEGKYILKQLSGYTYGKDFAFRDKQAIRVPLKEYISYKKFDEYVKDLILPKMKQRGAINMNYFNKAYRKMDEKDNALIIWKAVNFEAWCQLFVDGRKPI